MKTVAIIPAYNEAPKPDFESYLGSSIESVTECMKEGLISNAIFVDDGSTDDTNKIILERTREDSNIYLIKHENNLGKAKAFLTGLNKSLEYNPDILVTLDADMIDFKPEHLVTLIKPIIMRNVDMVRGTNYYMGSNLFNLYHLSGIRSMKYNTLSPFYEIKNKEYEKWKKCFEYNNPREGYRLELVLEAFFHSKKKEIVGLDELHLRGSGQGSYNIKEIREGINSLNEHYKIL